MTISAWKLDGRLARLRSDHFSAEVDLARPLDGVSHIRVPGLHVESIHLLGMAVPSRVEGEADSLQDAYVRSAELTATYRGSEAWPVRVDATWRVLAPSSPHEFTAAIDLLISVRTDRLQSQPRMAVESGFGGGEVASAADGCILFRPTQSDLSYLEMVHPLDLRGDELSGGGNTPFRIRHHLFDDCLEKGVVLRARLRGMLLTRGHDTQLAADHYAAFKAAEPPLGA